MPFNQNDLYSASAGTELYKYFNPFVTKFDSQSFYNWEQDNQPIYDLEERTFGLWEKATGYFTSSLNGMPLVVSGTADPNNRNIFTNLQDAVDSLPQVIRTPTLIEVAASGHLGGLKLKDIRVEGAGVLEIINRGFAKIYSGRGNGVTHVNASALGNASSVAAARTRGYVTELSSVDLSSTILNTSALSTSANCSSLFVQHYNRTFAQSVNFAGNRSRNSRLYYGFVDVGANSHANFLNTDTQLSATFSFLNYENFSYGATNNVKDGSCSSLDVSSFRQDTEAIIQRSTPATTWDRQMTGVTYANSVSSVLIEDCTGPLYLRGFCVDGVSGGGTVFKNSTYKNDIGITVVNSSPYIENCSVTRNKEVGAKFINSDVKLTRGFVANRNYEVGTDDPGETRNSRKTIGLHLINSRVDARIDPTYASGSDYFFNIQNHDTGILLENSTFVGGQSRPYTTMNDATLAVAYNDVGIKATNSVIDVSGNLDIYNNKIGVELKNSYVSTDRLTVENHTTNGITADNSVIKYNNGLVRRDYSVDKDSNRMAQTFFHRNGCHLNLNNSSEFSPYLDVSTINIPDKFGALRFNDSHGELYGPIPAISVNRSKADLVHARIHTSSLSNTTSGLRGAALKASNSSQVNFMGTVKGATIIVGSPDFGDSENVAGVCAENSSKVSFRGPTSIVQFGTCVLGENDSVVEFVPHKRLDQNLDVTGFNLLNKGNHTSVELHSTGKTCAAVVNNSQLIMENLGSPNTVCAIPNSDFSDSNIAKFVSAGSMQFYPNAALASYATNHIDVNLADVDLDSDVMTAAEHDQLIQPATGGKIAYNYLLTNPFTDSASATIQSTLSTGGMCVQAFGNSIVKANSVHFLTGYTLADGTYFDASSTAGGCNQLRIWNIGDTSKLYASHLAVSAATPSATPYHGPRSTFLSGLSEGGHGFRDWRDGSAIAYGALSSTPDTSTLSVCDRYGLGFNDASAFMTVEMSAINKAYTGDVKDFPHSSFLNKGPFRLFFSVNPMLRYVGYVSATPTNTGIDEFATGDTRPMQHLAQGYNLSGNIGVPSGIHDVTSTNLGLLHYTTRYGYSGQKAEASGYYFPSSVIDPNRGTNVYLDEGAADVFANAKNCAAPPIAGRASPNVSIYKSTTHWGGIGNPGNGGATYGQGAGLKSINMFDLDRSI